MATRVGDGALEELIVAAVRAPGDVEEVADEGDRADDGLDKNVEDHASENDVGNSASPCSEDDDRRGQASDNVARAGDKPYDAVEAEANAGSGDLDEVVEQVGEDVEMLVAEWA